MVVFPVAATIIAAALASATWRAGSASPRGAALRIWSIALAQFGVATGAMAWGIAFGWTPLIYRIFYLTGAVLNVAWLALGTVWLLAPRVVATVVNVLFIVAATIAAGIVMSTDLRSEAALAGKLPEPAAVMTDVPRLFSRIYSIAGSVVVLGGLGWSVVRRRHAVGLGLLAAGVFLAAVASEMVRSGWVEAFSFGLAVAIGVMYLGFMKTRT